MRTEAPSDLVVCNLPRLRSPLRVASPGKPFLREVPPFLPALLRQLQNRLDIAWAINVVFTHVLPWSRPAVFVEGNFLMANQARNVLPFFQYHQPKMEGSTAPGDHSHCAQIAAETHPGSPSPPFPLGPVFFFSSILTIGSLRLFLVCFAAVSFHTSELAPPPADSAIPDRSSSTRISSFMSILYC